MLPQIDVKGVHAHFLSYFHVACKLFYSKLFTFGQVLQHSTSSFLTISLASWPFIWICYLKVQTQLVEGSHIKECRVTIIIPVLDACYPCFSSFLDQHSSMFQKVTPCCNILLQGYFRHLRLNINIWKLYKVKFASKLTKHPC